MAATPITDLGALLAALQPECRPGTWAWCVCPDGVAAGDVEALASVREAEGLTLVVDAAQARARGWTSLFDSACITLRVASDLAAVGLTAAVAQALADAGIACNVIAGAHHDHLFVPVARADAALATLRALQARSAG